MKAWQEIGRQALRGALEARKKANVHRDAPVCVYDIADKLGVEVRFVGGPSFEGMFSKSKNAVLIPALRPPGRQVYACGHELGHWHFGHGSTVEDLKSLEMSKHLKPEDMLANTFASCLLAPPWAVKDAFERRSYDLSTAGPVEVYAVCCQLGLGYQTMIRHLQYSLQLLSSDRATELLSLSPKMIREKVLGAATSGHMVMVCSAWRSVPIDLRVGDVAVIPESALHEGSAVSETGTVSKGRVIGARKPGIAKVRCEQSGWAAYVRVSRQDYIGRAKYRHLEDPDVN